MIFFFMVETSFSSGRKSEKGDADATDTNSILAPATISHFVSHQQIVVILDGVRLRPCRIPSDNSREEKMILAQRR